MKAKSGYFLVALPLLLASVPSCDGSGDSSAIPMENACVELEKASCALLDRCEVGFIYELESHSTCQESINLCEGDFQEGVDSVNAGRMRYNEAQARLCINSVKSFPCQDIFSLIEGDTQPAGCNEMFAGLVEENGDCYFDDECADGLYCNSSVGVCPGACLPFQSIGGACDNIEVCNQEVADCSGGLCTALAGEGESCENISCQKGLECDQSVLPWRCIVPGGEGANCIATEQCQTGLRCVEGKCIGSAGNGQVCRVADYKELFFACQSGLYCDLDIIAEEKTGTCQPRKNQGEDCLLFLECRDGLLCIGVTVNQGQVTKGHCQPPLTAGSACNTQMGEMFVECRYDHYCNPQTSKCERLPGEGQNCGPDGPDCLGQDLYCDLSGAGICRPKKANGQGCSDSNECMSDYCADGLCADPESCSP